MKLHAVKIPLPRNVDTGIRQSIARAEESIRLNNLMIEQALADLERRCDILNMSLNDIADGQLEIVVGTQTDATGQWRGRTKHRALFDGMRILYRLPVAGSGNASLNLTLATGVETGDKPIYRYGTSRLTTHYGANSMIPLTYRVDTDAWYADADYSISMTYTSGYCTTAAGKAAKAASMTYFSLHENEWIFINFRYANTKKSKITLNINSTGAKDLYINGAISSASNYSFPAGSYLVFYDGTNYYLRTDGLLPQSH